MSKIKCISCGTPIRTGQYCSYCLSKKNKNKGTIVKTIAGILVGVGLSALGVKHPWKKK